MKIHVAEEPMPDLAEYASVPIAFEVRRVLDVAVLEGGLGGFVLSERDGHPPYVKDYDAVDGLASWPERFDLGSWGWIAARAERRRVGGAVVAFDTPGVEMLEGRRDLAVLWDIRVVPGARGRGACWAPSTASPTPPCRTKYSCSGTNTSRADALESAAGPRWANEFAATNTRSPPAWTVRHGRVPRRYRVREQSTSPRVFWGRCEPRRAAGARLEPCHRAGRRPILGTGIKHEGAEMPVSAPSAFLA